MTDLDWEKMLHLFSEGTFVIFTSSIISIPKILPTLFVCKISSISKQLISIYFNTYSVNKIIILRKIGKRLFTWYDHKTISFAISYNFPYEERCLVIL